MAETIYISGTFLFDPADKIYLDHFPGNPVVPGSLIIDAFFKAIKNIGFKPETFSINNFRFRKFIPPGEYKYSIEKAPSAFNCKLFQNEKAAVTGEILI